MTSPNGPGTPTDGAATAPSARLGSLPRPWIGVLAFGILLASFGVAFLFFGEFGGWYYDGRGGYQTSEYSPSTDDYRSVWRQTGSESWGSDRLFTQPALIFPLTLAIAALVGALVVMARLALRPEAPIRRRLLLTGTLASAASLVIAVQAILYAASMSEGDEWWFGSAFWAGFINSTLLAILAFGLLRAKDLWPPQKAKG